MNKKLNRRALLKLGLAATAAGSTPPLALAQAQAQGEKQAPNPNYMGVLVDTALCIGCRKCEEACNRRNNLPRTAESFSDREILRSFRRPSETAFTAVNQFPGSPSPDQAGVPQTYCKVQCMHCLYPACVSACIVGALIKSPDGAVVYNPTICIGCRYCQVACPFEIPAYEFDEPLLPRVRKCEFCADRAKGTGANPACAASCHETMEDKQPQSCTRCHGLPNEPDGPARIGLKGAYHRQCIGCHERQAKPTSAPTECAACHHPLTPDHSTLVSLGSNPSPQDVTRACLDCHPKVGQHLLKTAHWNWKGSSPTLAGFEHRTDTSLRLMVNNYCIAIGSIHHQVVPAEKALSCSDCHSPAAVSCSRCHKGASGAALPGHRLAVYPEVKDRIDFKALGYDDDPALMGGRFQIDIGLGSPVR